MIELAFTIDLICRSCRRVLVASFGELPEGERQSTFTLPSCECAEHPGAGNRLVFTVRRGHTLPARHGAARELE